MTLLTIIVFLVAWGYFSDRILRYLRNLNNETYTKVRFDSSDFDLSDFISSLQSDFLVVPRDGYYAIGWMEELGLVYLKKGERFPIPPR